MQQRLEAVQPLAHREAVKSVTKAVTACGGNLSANCSSSIDIIADDVKVVAEEVSTAILEVCKKPWWKNAAKCKAAVLGIVTEIKKVDAHVKSAVAECHLAAYSSTISVTP